VFFQIITTPEASQVSQMITWYPCWRTKLYYLYGYCTWTGVDINHCDRL